MSLPEVHSPEVAATSNMTSEQLQRRIAELTEALAARDAFIAVAAHELRNPMTPMIGQIEFLLTGVKVGKYSTEQIGERLDRIYRSMRHFLKRAAILLDVSRITSGKFKLEPGNCDLSDVVRQVAETFAEAARHAGASIEIDVPASLPGSWDRMAVEQIIDNLVSNAIKYGGRNLVVVHATQVEGGVLIKVRDHGPGISARDRSRIFGRFERAVGASERHSGFGVGLWVVGQLVDAMEGTITVDDAQGGGSVFKVTVPQSAKAIIYE